MIEQTPSIPIDYLEKQRASNIIQIFTKAGYLYDVKPSHEDRTGRIHFQKDIDKKAYPHLHLIYVVKDQQFTVHLDTRKHRVKYFSPYISEELERLYTHFTTELEQRESTTFDLVKSLAKQAISLAMFSSPEEIARKQLKERSREIKFHKQRQLRKQNKYHFQRRKYNTVEAEYGGIVEDCEPLAETIAKLIIEK